MKDTLKKEELQKELEDIEALPESEKMCSTIQRYWILSACAESLLNCKWWEFEKKRQINMIFSSAVKTLKNK